MIQSPRLVKKNKQIRMRRLFVWPSVAVFTILVVIWLSRMQSVSVTRIDISGNSVIKADDVSALVERDLSGNFLKIFPKKNIFIYPRGQIEKDVLATFPRADSVSISLGDSRALAIDLTLRKPVSLWCASASSTLSDILSESCYFFDKNGFIFAPAPNFEGPVFVKYYGILSGDPIKQVFLGGETISKLGSFLEGLDNSLKLTATNVYLKDDYKEYDVFLSNGVGLYISGNVPFEDSLNNLALFLNSSSTKQIDISKFNYIDLRYGNKIYYKLKN